MVSSVSSGLNTGNITVGTDGKVHISGISSGIDSQALIAAQIAAASVPITNLQTKITANNTLNQAYKDLKTKTTAFQTSLDALRNSLAFGATNAFTAKTATGTTTAAVGAPNGYVASDINTLMGTSFTSKAQNASHTIVIKQLAQAQQISTDSQGVATNVALGMSGTLTINGKNVTVQATDTMLDVRDKINAAGANVNATIVSGDATHNYLILSSNTTGTGSNAISLTQTALSDSLGFTDGNVTSDVAKNELKEARNAIIDVDGITNVTRSSNVISDVIDGVTLSLQKQEPDTVINLKVTPDLNGIKTAIGDFVAAYNDLRAFITDQNTASDRNKDGTVDAGEFGPLYNNSILRGIGDQLSAMNAMQLKGNTDGFQSLGQIGVVQKPDFTLAVDDSVMDPKLLGNVDAVARLFGFGFTSSDSRISAVDRSNNTVDGTYYLSIAGTDANGIATGARISGTAGTGNTSDGSLTFNSNVFTGTATTAANGLVVGFNNSAANLGPIDDIQVTVSRGIADSFYDYFKQLNAAGIGTLDTATVGVADQNDKYQSQINTLNTRIDQQKVNLTNKYAAMETALAQLAQLQNQIAQFFKSDSSN
ncbi:MAG TPA: flagellar filament capping protein FliD [Alphaproteobacteria bacterium]|nr:flagellar filament capping protein FliD [Alphaproteobacteria bacterium]